MTEIVILNLLLAAAAAATPNDRLAVNSYIFYGVQAVLLLPYLLRRLGYLKNAFLPSFFVLVYSLVNFTLGSYLVPRGFGWNKNFAPVLLRGEHYRVIVPFLLLANLVLFLTARASLRRLAHINGRPRGGAPTRVSAWSGATLTKQAICAVGFFICARFDVYSAFSFELALVILALSDGAIHKSRYRYLLYAFYVLVAAAYDFDNKREIVMVLFVVIFMEAYDARTVFTLTVRRVAACVAAGAVFVVLVLVASVMRGYGEYPVTSFIDGVSYVPQYVASDIFVDGLIDNLELNYSYGCTVTSMEFVLNGRMNYQFGATLVKPLFLPVSREALPIKPESAMRLFTNEYATAAWAANGSLPIAFAAESFLNFHYYGLFAYAAIWVGIDWLFLKIHTTARGSFVFCSWIFLCLTILMLARGSGLEQWLLYYLVGAPLFGAAAAICAGRTTERVPSAALEVAM